MRTPTLTGLLSILVLTACGDARQLPTAVTTDSPSLNKGGATSNPRAALTYYTTPGGLTGGSLHGDSRDGYGGPSATIGVSVYDDGRCGVAAQIFSSGSQDVTMDPIAAKVNNRNCSTTAARSLTVTYGTALSDPALAPAANTAGHYTNVRGILRLTTIGAADTRRFRLMLRGTRACYHLRYGRSASSTDDSGTGAPDSWNGVTSLPILVTRVALTSEETAAGAKAAWIAESQADAEGRHVAFCERDPDNVVIAAYDIPFRIRVIQKN